MLHQKAIAHNYIYLHGFASSPNSDKAVYFSDRLPSLQVLDLNQGDFSHLTLSRQINQVAATFSNEPVTLIGSSLGGLTAAWLAQKYLQVQRLVLLAPAFGFLAHWLPKLGKEQLQQWQTQGYLSVYHYGERRSLPLHYNFVTDAVQYRDENLQRPVPTLILHGLQDETIPIAASRNYSQTRPWVELIELNSDHALMDAMPEIWQITQRFCELNPEYNKLKEV